MNIITPERLKAGDKVAIVSSARKITNAEILPAKKLFESWGLEVICGASIGAECCQFAGSDELRTLDIQMMLDDKDIKALFFARGGYGSVRIMDKLNWNALKTNPKWLVGYSDVTALLMHAYYNVPTESIHGIMPVNITDDKDNEAVKTLKHILFEGDNQMFCTPCELNRKGFAQGRIIGGNLSVIYSLLGSNSFEDTDGLILVIEDLDEYLYHIDRMMQALKRADKLKRLKALLVGQMTQMHDNAVPFGCDANHIIAQCIKDFDFPVAYNVPIGHTGGMNHAFIHGRISNVVITDTSVVISQ